MKRQGSGGTSFPAMLYKDFKLFFSAAGLLTVLIPFILIGAFLLGGKVLEKGDFLQAFPIAIQDHDHTIMSRTLVSQLKAVDQFSEVRVLEDTDDPLDALRDGAAGVLVIPKDYFYAMYRAEDSPVELILNREAGLPAVLLHSMLDSVLQIVSSSEASTWGLYHWMYGTELSQEQKDDMYAVSSRSILKYALSRQNVILDPEEDESLITSVGGMLLRRILAVVIPMILFGFSLMAVKTLPEERSLGVTDRMKAIGCGAKGALLSKLLIVLLTCLPLMLFMFALLPPGSWLRAAVSFILLECSAFAGAWFVCECCGTAALTQRAGVLILAASVLLSGKLWPCILSPGLPERLGRLTLPFHSYAVLEAAHSSLSWGELLPLFLTILLKTAAECLLANAAWIFRRNFTEIRRAPGRNAGPGGGSAAASGRTPLLFRLPVVTSLKLKNLGGYPGWLVVLAAAAFLLGSVSAVTEKKDGDLIRVYAADLDRTEASEGLLEELRQTEGLSLQIVPAEKARLRLLTEGAEGLLLIPEGFEETLEADGDIGLMYQAASGVSTEQSVREMIAGAVTIRRTREDAVLLAEERLERKLSGEELEALDSTIRKMRKELPPPMRAFEEGGAAPKDPFVPERITFLWFLILMLGLLLADFSGSAESRQIAFRMRTIPGGLILSSGSDILALAAACLVPGLLFIAGSGLSPQKAVILVCFSFFVSCFGLMISSFTASEGRIDGLACYLSVLLCILGGCFMDVAAAAPQLAGLVRLSPVGAALAAEAGSAAGYAVLIGGGFLCGGISIARSSSV